MVKAFPKSLTLDEFLKLPETEPGSEYINGYIIQKPMPQGEHSAIQTELASAINSSLKSQQIARAFSELRCTFGERSIIPDISVFAWENIPHQANGKVANTFLIPPDWIIEILSPEENPTKVIKNILYCLSYGTQMGWLIDPEEQTIFVYLPDRPTTVYETAIAPLPVPPFVQGFHLTLEQVFQWLLD